MIGSVLASVRKTITLPAISSQASTIQAILAVSVVLGFLVLLLQSQIHPVIVYVLQLFLTL